MKDFFLILLCAVGAALLLTAGLCGAALYVVIPPQKENSLLRLENAALETARECNDLVVSQGTPPRIAIEEYLKTYIIRNGFSDAVDFCITKSGSASEIGTVFSGNEQFQALTASIGRRRDFNGIISGYDSFLKVNYIAAKWSYGEFNSVVLMPVSEFSKPSRRAYMLILLCGATVFIFALGGILLFTRRLAREMEIVSSSLGRLCTEDYSPFPNVEPLNPASERIFESIRSLIRDQKSRKSEQEKSSAAIQQTQKLESIGILAGGIAHDFNNLLTAIRGNLQLALMFSETPETRRCLTDCESAAVRAAALTKQLLTFSAGGKPVKSIVSVPELVESFSTFVLRGSRVKCTIHSAENVLPVEADAGQLGQAVDNIVINASQSMPEGGTITIDIDNYYHKSEVCTETGKHNTQRPAAMAFPTLKTDNCESLLPLGAGAYVRISFTDNGCGIGREALEKIFDPFFTTKATGSGLGLATTYEIIRKHGGFIAAFSEEGVGTEFRIYLPASPELVASANVSEGGSQQESLYNAGGYVMVMDDQESIRALLARMFSLMNCRCDFAADGTEMIEKYKSAKAAGTPYDILFMDLTIPGGMGGKEAIGIIRETDKKVKAVVASGYSNDPVIADYVEYGFDACLQKPFKITDISAIMHRLMNRASKKR